MLRRKIILLPLIHRPLRQLTPQPRVPQEVRRIHHRDLTLRRLWQRKQLRRIPYDRVCVGAAYGWVGKVQEADVYKGVSELGLELSVRFWVCS